MKSSSENSNTHDGDASWWERNVNLVIGVLLVACVLTVVAQCLCGTVLPPLFDDHHPAHFDIENMLGWQAIIGFVAFVVIVFLGRLLRLVIKRSEDYYDA